jgi:hypothetical protein
MAECITISCILQCALCNQQLTQQIACFVQWDVRPRLPALDRGDPLGPMDSRSGLGFEGEGYVSFNMIPPADRHRLQRQNPKKKPTEYRRATATS